MDGLVSLASRKCQWWSTTCFLIPQKNFQLIRKLTPESEKRFFEKKGPLIFFILMEILTLNGLRENGQEVKFCQSFSSRMIGFQTFRGLSRLQIFSRLSNAPNCLFLSEMVSVPRLVSSLSLLVSLSVSLLLLLSVLGCGCRRCRCCHCHRNIINN